MGAAMLNNKVNNKHDLPAANRQPVIAELPQMSKKESKNTKLFIQDEHSVIAECFHILRNNVDSMLPRPEQGDMSFWSPPPSPEKENLHLRQSGRRFRLCRQKSTAY